MAEVSYAKQFLSLLDSRPIKIPGDHVQDPRSLPSHIAYCLPKRSNEYHKTPPTASKAPSSGAVTVQLRALKPPPNLPNPLPLSSIQPSSTSIYDLKLRAAARAGYAPEKVKILWEKKPVSDSRTVADVVGNVATESTLEFGAMYVGAPTLTPVDDGGPVGSEASIAGHNAEEAASRAGGGGKDVQMSGTDTGVGQGSTGWEVLKTEGFWEDLHGWALQRTRDESVAKGLVTKLREAWDQGSLAG